MLLEIEMIPVPSGKFLMGTFCSNDNSEPQHEVSVQSFLMSKYTITQAQWRTVAGWEQVDRKLKVDPSSFKGDDLPVERVSWYDAVEFCARLSARTGRTYRLPTEAEWEYACRAGTETPFHFGEELTPELANYNLEQTTQVGQFPANDFGLHDMHGNVWEWCLDDWHDSYKGAPTDGKAWLNSDGGKSGKVLRGGSCGYFPDYCGSAFRAWCVYDDRPRNYGLRVVEELPIFTGVNWAEKVNALLSDLNAGTDAHPYSGLMAEDVEDSEAVIRVFDDYASLVCYADQVLKSLSDACPVNWNEPNPLEEIWVALKICEI
jgi:formylglycine-generating enzyme required for sulfatase activity